MLDAARIEGPPGRDWCRAWTDAVDAEVRRWLRGFVADSGRRSGGVAVVALGSYARKALCARSDVDLLLLHDGWAAADLSALVQAVCYPLWDAGLTVGHAVHTPRDAIRRMGDRIDQVTAVTERRLVAGDAGLADDLSVRVRRWLSRKTGRIVTDVGAANAERWARFGNVPGALEPDLKNGVGGLRDLHSLRWAAAALLSEPSLDALVGARYLGASDRRDLAQAEDTLLEARAALHLLKGGRIGNALRLDLQADVARLLPDEDADQLLRRVGLAHRTVAHLHSRTWPLLAADAVLGRRRHRSPRRRVADGVVLDDGLIEIDPTQAVEPDLAPRAVAAAARYRTVLARDAAHRLRRRLEDVGRLQWREETRQSLMTCLAAGPDAIGALADADHIGLLERLFDEWGRVRGRPQRNPLHTYDLDTHGLQAVATLVEIGHGLLDPSHERVWSELDEQDSLILGTWLHDVGKAWPGDHAVAGERVAAEWVTAAGFDERTVDRVARIVRHHLLLPDTAQGRDLDDPAEIERVAVAVGDADLLDRLFLLALADCRATGPAVTSPWKDLLITTLYERTRELLVAGEVPLLGDRPHVVVKAAARVAGVDERQVQATLEGLPARYLANAGPLVLGSHASLLAVPLGEGEVRAAVHEGPVEGTHLVTMAGRDRFALLADAAGVLTTHRLDVLDARVFGRADGVALLWFTVSAPASVEWSRALADLAGVGRIDVATRVERREAARDARPPALAGPLTVVVDLHERPDRTIVDVRAPDRPGTLYRLTSAFVELGVPLLSAQVASLGPEVRDTFHLPKDLGVGRDQLVAALEKAAGAPSA